MALIGPGQTPMRVTVRVAYTLQLEPFHWVKVTIMLGRASGSSAPLSAGSDSIATAGEVAAPKAPPILSTRCAPASQVCVTTLYRRA